MKFHFGYRSALMLFAWFVISSYKPWTNVLGY